MKNLTSAQASWNPGLDNAESSLASAYRSLPGDTAGTVPWYVVLLENPASPLALAGAVDLFAHDCVHVLLGRGLLQQDEAFVLGFTMGSSRRCSALHTALFRVCARRLYRGTYRFSAQDDEVFAFAVAAARRLRSVPLDSVDFRAAFERPPGSLRRSLGLDVAALRALYAEEAARWPLTSASARLPVFHLPDDGPQSENRPR